MRWVDPQDIFDAFVEQDGDADSAKWSTTKAERPLVGRFRLEPLDISTRDYSAYDEDSSALEPDRLTTSMISTVAALVL